MSVQVPVFVVGAGRSGSTAFHRVLSRHPEVAWLAERICNKYPDQPELNRTFLKLIDIPILGEMLANKIHPGESYPFWENHCRGFSEPCRDLVATDVTQMSKSKTINTLSKMTTNRRPRLVIKITGWSRIGYLKEIFDDAKFIHIVRDGRAVTNSLLNVDFWRGWKGPNNWRWGELTDGQMDEWHKYDKSFLVLAAIQWKLIIDAVENARVDIDKNDFLEVKYEDLCSQPHSVFKKVQEFSGLSEFAKFDSFVQNYKWRNTNNKWREQFTPQQQGQLEEVLDSYLSKYDYL